MRSQIKDFKNLTAILGLRSMRGAQLGLLKLCLFIACTILIACNPLGTVSSVDTDFGKKTVSNTVQWDYDSASEYSLSNSSLSAIAGGSASLTQINSTVNSSAGFNGTSVGTYYTGSSYTLQPSSYAAFTSDWTPEFSSIVAYWKLDETAANTAPGGLDTEDFSGNGYHMTETATITYGATGKVKNAFSFDGVGSLLTASIASGPISQFDWSTDFSVSMWVRPDPVQAVTVNTENKPFYISASTGYFMNFWITNQTSGTPGRVRVFRYNGTTSKSITSTKQVNDNQFHHLGFTKTGTTMKLYVDGELQGTTTEPSSVVSHPTTIYLSLSAASNSSFKGDIDEVGIWQAPLSDSDMSAIYARQSAKYANNTELNSTWSPQWSSLVGYWPMDGNWTDSSESGNTGTAVADATFSTTAKIGTHSGTFDGTGDQINFASQVSTQVDNITMSAWVNWNATTGTSEYIFYNGSAGANGWGITLNNTASDAVNLLIGGVANRSTGIILSSGVWYHIAFVRRSGTWEFYLDGEKDSTFTYTDTPNTPSGTPFSGVTYNGKIDDLAVWQTALTAGEIGLIYNRQKQKYSGIYTSPVLDSTNTSSYWSTLAWTSELPFLKELPNASGYESDIEYSSIYNSTTLNTGLVALWHLDETPASTTAYYYRDSSGNEAHATLASVATASTATGQFSNGLKSTGNVNLATAANPAPNPNDQLTLSFWIKHSGPVVGSGFGSYIGKINAAVSGWQLDGQNVAGTTAKIRTRIDTSAAANQTFTMNTSVFDNQWHHIIYILNSGNGYFYRDGVLDKSFTYLHGTGFSSSSAISIKGNNFYGGTLDEVAIWSRTLTQTEITQLYRRGANRIKYQVRSCSSANCSDQDWQGPDNTSATWFSELHNCTGYTTTGACNFAGGESVTLTAPNLAFTDFSSVGAGLSVANNRYFQYRLLMESDDTTTSPYLPTLSSLTISPTHYATSSPSVTTLNGAAFIKWTAFSETVTGGCTVTHQVSLDKSTWYYFNSSNWNTATSDTQSSTATTLNAGVAKFASQIGTGILYIKSFLNSNGTQSCSLEKITVSVEN